MCKSEGPGRSGKGKLLQDNLWLGVQAISILSLSKAPRIPVPVGVLLKLSIEPVGPKSLIGC